MFSCVFISFLHFLIRVGVGVGESIIERSILEVIVLRVYSALFLQFRDTSDSSGDSFGPYNQLHCFNLDTNALTVASNFNLRFDCVLQIISSTSSSSSSIALKN